MQEKPKFFRFQSPFTQQPKSVAQRKINHGTEDILLRRLGRNLGRFDAAGIIKMSKKSKNHEIFEKKSCSEKIFNF